MQRVCVHMAGSSLERLHVRGGFVQVYAHYGYCRWAHGEECKPAKTCQSLQPGYETLMVKKMK